MPEGDCLLYQAELTLNLLRSGRLNPKLSAWAFLFGQFDYNRTPLVPPGIKVLAHSKIDNRASWALHGEEGSTIGPSLENYHCVRSYFPKICTKKDNDTITFFPKNIHLPDINIDSFLCQAATDTISLFTTSTPTTTLYLAAGDTTKNSLLQLARNLHTIPEEPKQTPTSVLPTPPETTLVLRVQQKLHPW